VAAEARLRRLEATVQARRQRVALDIARQVWRDPRGPRDAATERLWLSHLAFLTPERLRGMLYTRTSMTPAQVLAYTWEHAEDARWTLELYRAQGAEAVHAAVLEQSQSQELADAVANWCRVATDAERRWGW
jgi:hypothetical protein